MFDEVHIIDVGRYVICDLCNKDWTNSPVSGGYLFSSYGVCPDCATGKFNDGVIANGEEKYITARCPENMSHADWVRKVLR